MLLLFLFIRSLLRVLSYFSRGVYYVLLLTLLLIIGDGRGTPVCEDPVDAGAGALEGGLFMLDEEGAFLVELVGGFEVQWVDQVGIYFPVRQEVCSLISR